MRVLITAGATRNPVDAIRYLSANATGKTGVQLADWITTTRRGSVTFLGSDRACLQHALLERNVVLGDVLEFTDTMDLMRQMKTLVPNHDVVVHSAAVGDYMVDAITSKIPSGQREIFLRLTPGPKIIDHIKDWNPACRLVSFKAATPGTSSGDLVRIAQSQIARTRSDIVFANVIGFTEDAMLVTSSGVLFSGCRPEAIEQLINWISAGSVEQTA